MTYEHPAHAAARQARVVPPSLPIEGWRQKPEPIPSLPGQLLLAVVVTEIHKGQARKVSLPIKQNQQRRLF
jgi:hypothetical protein